MPALTRRSSGNVNRFSCMGAHVITRRRRRAPLLLAALSLCAVGLPSGGADAYPDAAGEGPPSGVTRPAPATIPQSPQGVTKHIEAELSLEPRAAAPGSAIKVAYVISSYADEDERVRLKLEAGSGWRLLDSGIEKLELLLERWENIEGELYLVVPDDARVGDKQRVRLLVELVDEGGVIQAQDQATVSRRGGAKPGVPMVAATGTVGVSRLGAGAIGPPQLLAAASASTAFGKGSLFSLFFDRGLRGMFSNFRFEEARTRLSGNLRHRGWEVNFGNFVPSPGHTLAGPYVVGRGASVSRPAGRMALEVVAAQPNTLGGKAGGHLLRARLGVRTPRVSVGLNASKFGRPPGGYTTLPAVQQRVVDADEQERIDIERRLTANAASNRVSGLGVDADFRPAPSHRLRVRSGGLWLSNAAGARARGAAAEASYEYSSTRGDLNVRWRETPPGVQGISTFGDELAADGGVPITPAVRLVGSAYRNSLDVVGSHYSSCGDGASFGVRFTRGRRRLEVRGNYRETEFFTHTARRTVSVAFALAAGPLSVSANADVGSQTSDRGPGLTAFCRGEVRWQQDDKTLTLTATHSAGFGGSRDRLDLNGSWRVRGLEFAGGAWATRGYASGGPPGGWSSVGFPIGGGRFLIVALDYSPPIPAAHPGARVMLAIRQGLALPMPFVPRRPISGQK